MQRIVEDRVARAHFNRMAQVDHQDLVGDVTYDRKIVRNKHIGQCEFVLQRGKKIEHLGAYRNVEGRYRLIEHKDFRS